MIEVENLRFTYGGGKEILHGLDFSVGEGEIFGFLGPNGSGKSTTQKILTGVLKGHTGKAALFGRDISELNRRTYYENIGVLFEFPYLYGNLSALDNLNYFASFYPKERRRDARELLERLQFKPEFLNKPVSSYSKGMRQRVSMARALINSPKLLFLDEPTSGLDPTGSVLFRRLIEEERDKGTTVFVTTHNMMDADLLCDRVAFMVNGDLVALDTPKRLKESGSEGKVVVDYLLNGERLSKEMDLADVVNGISFPHDQIISAHTQEPTLEDMFIKYTGRGLT